MDTGKRHLGKQSEGSGIEKVIAQNMKFGYERIKELAQSHNDFHSGYTSLHTHKGFLSLIPSPVFVVICLLMIAILTRMR